MLITWFIHPDDASEPDKVTGMWKLCPECDENGEHPVQVIHLDTILRGAHLLPCYGEGFLPTDLKYSDALDAWDFYFVNQFIRAVQSWTYSTTYLATYCHISAMAVKYK
jgi:hypothetical protein